MGIISTICKSGIALGVFAAMALWPLGNQVAADDPGKGVWSGVYIGGGLGVASGDSVEDFYNIPTRIPVDLDRAAVGGFHLGIQRQWGRFVAGLETSALFGGLNGSSDASSACSPDTCSVDVSRIWMIGPRVGLAANNLHFYGTGGYALGTLESKTVGGAGTETGHGRHSGWYLGGGVEWSLGRALVLGVEYRRIELGDDTHYSSTGIAAGARDVDATIDTIMGRLTFKIGDILHGMPAR